ncbi:MAG: hypothetical protein KC912_19145 [Proteobacteria bacterium]|nr:hypothetical protein [Pseudomonadota bacterium]
MNPDLSSRLGSALAKMDSMDPSFKTLRDDERAAQQTKLWKILCKEIDGHLREAAEVVVNAHQVGLDIGSDGGGRDQKPFIEEVNEKFPRLEYRLQNGKVIAVCNNRGLAQVEMDGIEYDWIEATIVTWLVWLIEQGGR